jgi:hypothetical protein
VLCTDEARCALTVSDDLAAEAEKLLAVVADEFVAERQRLARELREAGRSDEAATVARLRKPPPVVLAVNRAVRARPKAARRASDAALRVKKTQVDGEPDAYRRALDELDGSLDLLAQVAVAHVAPRGKGASDAMRRRIHDLLRSAVADDGAREALRRGVLVEEQEASGFSPFAGMSPQPGRRGGGTAAPSQAKQRDAKRREREQALRDELTRAEQELHEAEQSVRQAERDRVRAEQAVASLRAKLERLA